MESSRKFLQWAAYKLIVVSCPHNICVLTARSTAGLSSCFALVLAAGLTHLPAPHCSLSTFCRVNIFLAPSCLGREALLQVLA